MWRLQQLGSGVPAMSRTPNVSESEISYCFKRPKCWGCLLLKRNVAHADQYTKAQKTLTALKLES